MFKIPLFFGTICLSFGLFQCKVSHPVPAAPDNISSSKYEDRLMAGFLDQGQVVSVDSNGTPQGLGDSLLFTGIALGTLPCDKAETLFQSFITMQKDNNNYLVRFNPLQSSMKGDAVSRDGAVGAWYGLINYKLNCPDQAPNVQNVINNWVGAVSGHVLLHPDSEAFITPAFYAFWEAVQGQPMSTIAYGDYIAGMFLSAKSIQEGSSSCYPIHLQTLENILLETEGMPILEADKSAWCDITKDFGLLLTDWYCQRNSDKIQSWLQNPDESPFLYMHQRCSWESSDTTNMSSPRVDFLILNRHINNED